MFFTAGDYSLGPNIGYYEVYGTGSFVRQSSAGAFIRVLHQIHFGFVLNLIDIGIKI